MLIFPGSLQLDGISHLRFDGFVGPSIFFGGGGGGVAGAEGFNCRIHGTVFGWLGDLSVKFMVNISFYVPKIIFQEMNNSREIFLHQDFLFPRKYFVKATLCIFLGQL